MSVNTNMNGGSADGKSGKKDKRPSALPFTLMTMRNDGILSEMCMETKTMTIDFAGGAKGAEGDTGDGGAATKLCDIEALDEYIAKKHSEYGQGFLKSFERLGPSATYFDLRVRRSDERNRVVVDFSNVPDGSAFWRKGGDGYDLNKLQRRKESRRKRTPLEEGVEVEVAAASAKRQMTAQDVIVGNVPASGIVNIQADPQNMLCGNFQPEEGGVTSMPTLQQFQLQPQLQLQLQHQNFLQNVTGGSATASGEVIQSLIQKNNNQMAVLQKQHLYLILQNQYLQSLVGAASNTGVSQQDGIGGQGDQDQSPATSNDLLSCALLGKILASCHHPKDVGHFMMTSKTSYQMIVPKSSEECSVITEDSVWRRMCDAALGRSCRAEFEERYRQEDEKLHGMRETIPKLNERIYLAHVVGNGTTTKMLRELDRERGWADNVLMI